MSESSFESAGDPVAGATVDGEDSVNSAQADREAGFDDPSQSASGDVTDDDAVVANPLAGTAVNETFDTSGSDTSHDADVAAGYDDKDSASTDS